MAADEKKSEFRTSIAVILVLTATDLFQDHKNLTRSTIISLIISGILILLFYLKYKDKLTNFTPTQRNTAILIVSSPILILLVCLFFL